MQLYPTVKVRPFATCTASFELQLLIKLIVKLCCSTDSKTNWKGRNGTIQFKIQTIGFIVKTTGF
jgi:hypothetical protein